jgi:biopolymer transport protein TolQ
MTHGLGGVMTGFWLVAQGSFGTFWSLIAQSGPVALFVLLVLLFFSILSWTIIVTKVRAYKKVEEQSFQFSEFFRRSSSLSEIHRACDEYPLSPLAGIFKTGYRELDHWIQAKGGRSRTNPSEQHVTMLSIGGLERALRKAASAEMTTLEGSLSWLATTGSVTPFIGLFGTVIGIINAFQGLGEGSGTTIQAVAPGISEALVATAAGLFAAIPAVIAYNHFLNRLKVIGIEMDDFTTELLNLIERSFS